MGTLGRVLLLGLASALVAACGSNPPRQPVEARGQTGPALPEQAAMVALAMAGVPYRWGGADPAGFDCSGLVHFAYGQVGRSVPRTAEEQMRHARRIPLERLSAGDLLFFRLEKTAHVGLYTGDGRFVHAPSTGKTVSITSLDNPYWRERLIAAGRLE